MAKRGRPTLLDEAKRREICALVSTGIRRTNAARYVGCSLPTLRRTTDRDPQFAEQLRQAEATTELSALAAIREQATRSWRAAAWLLERLHTDRYGHKPAHVLSIGEFEAFLNDALEVVQQNVTDQQQATRVLVQLSALSVRYRRLGADAEHERGEDLLGELVPPDLLAELAVKSSSDSIAAHAGEPAAAT